MAKFSFSRLRPTIQPMVIKFYKVFGFVALAGILIGLIGFLTVNVFYVFDRSWIRPVILSPQHERVVQANAGLADAMRDHDALIAERGALQADLAQLQRTIDAASHFDAAIAAADPEARMSPYESLMLARAREQAIGEQAFANDRRATLEQQLVSLAENITRYEHLVAQSKDSPYIRAMEGSMTVAFVPYENVHNASPGTPIYGCKWGLVRCSRVGKVLSKLEGEVQDAHPHDKGVRRGVMLEVQLDEAWAAEDNALFVGSKPFWIF